MPEDYYNILGVSREATDVEIKKAFYKKAHQYHPDKKNGDTEKFKKANEAYQVLSDKQKKSQYDQFGSTFDQAQAGGGGGNPFGGFGGAQGFNVNMEDFDLGDIFSSFFGGRQKTARQTSNAVPGNDISVDINIDFKDVYQGLEKELELYKKVKCSHCKGTSAEPGTKINTCSKCQGTGQVKRASQTMFGVFSRVSACPECQSQGKIPEQNCSQCSGQGRKQEYEKVEIEIPAGIKNGQTIEIRGRGEDGAKGGPSGNLYITVHLNPNKTFKREGDNLIYELPISFTQAALGDEVEIPTLDKKIVFKIPNGTQSHQKFEISSKGFPHLNGYGQGNLIIKTHLITPTKLSGKEKKLFYELTKLKGQATKPKESLFNKIFK